MASSSVAPGNDRVADKYGGRFLGGPAPDSVGEMFHGAKFVGARGNDRVGTMTDATYHGGAGVDSLYQACGTGNTITSVEIVATGTGPC